MILDSGVRQLRLWLKLCHADTTLELGRSPMELFLVLFISLSPRSLWLPLCWWCPVNKVPDANLTHFFPNMKIKTRQCLRSIWTVYEYSWVILKTCEWGFPPYAPWFLDEMIKISSLFFMPYSRFCLATSCLPRPKTRCLGIMQHTLDGVCQFNLETFSTFEKKNGLQK